MDNHPKRSLEDRFEMVAKLKKAFFGVHIKNTFQATCQTMGNSKYLYF